MAASLGLIGLEGDRPKLAQSKADLSAINRKTSVLVAGVLGGDLHLTLLGGRTHRLQQMWLKLFVFAAEGVEVLVCYRHKVLHCPLGLSVVPYR